jgi:hypothetical protein
MMGKCKAQHRIIMQGIAWAQPHGSFEVSNRRIRFAIPASHESAALEARRLRIGVFRGELGKADVDTRNVEDCGRA